MAAPAPEAKKAAGADGLAWAIIGIALILLVGIGAVAYNRGLIKLPARTGQPHVITQPPPATPPTGTAPPTAAESEAAAQASLADPLAMLDDDVAGIAPYREFRSYLRELDGKLSGFKFETGEDGALTEASVASLDALNILGNELNQKYKDFEERCKTETAEELRAYQSTLRRAFRDRMVALVQVLGSANKLERDSTRVVYTLPDTFVASINQYGIENPEPISAAWLEAIKEREEAILNADNATIINTLEAKKKALSDVHNQFNIEFAATPPYHVNSGVLGQDAAALLDKYESLATKVEELVVDMEAYTATIPEDKLSERMKEIIQSFTDLAQQDHLYCFHEAYTIYILDRDLTHNTYRRLKDHYEFAREHWPRMVESYVQVYTESESAWDQRWKND
jgi:hypothetical protein